MQPLPVIQTIVTAYQFVWQDRQAFGRVAAVPVVALALAGTLIGILAPEMPPPPADGGPIRPEDIPLNVGGLFHGLLSLVFYVMFAVAWHRKWLMPDESITISSALRWDGRKSAFLGRLILIMAMAMLAALPVTFLAVIMAQGGFLPLQAGVVMTLIVVLVTFARLAIMLPAAAVDESMPVKDCWLTTRGNGLRLFLIVLLPTVPVLVAQVVALWVFLSLVASMGLAGTLTGSLLTNLLGETFSYVGIAVSVSALSISYRHFRDQAPPVPVDEG